MYVVALAGAFCVGGTRPPCHGPSGGRMPVCVAAVRCESPLNLDGMLPLSTGNGLKQRLPTARPRCSGSGTRFPDCHDLFDDQLSQRFVVVGSRGAGSGGDTADDLTLQPVPLTTRWPFSPKGLRVAPRPRGLGFRRPPASPRTPTGMAGLFAAAESGSHPPASPNAACVTITTVHHRSASFVSEKHGACIWPNKSAPHLTLIASPARSKRPLDALRHRRRRDSRCRPRFVLR